MNLADFIDAERETIVSRWEDSAHDLLPAAGETSRSALRDHAVDILAWIAREMRLSADAGAEAPVHGAKRHHRGVRQIHAAIRIEHVLKLTQIVAEYRALRTSVLRLWEKHGTDPPGVTRFNEALDEALGEAVDRFTKVSEHYREQTLGILGHDVRTPLSAIITGATLLLDAEKVGPRNVIVSARVLSTGRRLKRMIDDLLDLTRTRFGDPIPIAPAPADIDPICQQVLAELEGLQPNLPLLFATTGADRRGTWDKQRIRQALSHLVQNAIEHGGGEHPVEVVARDADADVVVEIHDRRPPLREEALATLFDPMVPHGNGYRANGGPGRGLFIAAQIVAAHGGRIDVVSTAEEGTRFSMRLPRRAPVDPLAAR